MRAASRGVINIEPRWLVVCMEGEGEIALAVEEAAVGHLVDEALESPEKASVAEKRRGEGGGWNGRGLRKIDLENSDALQKINRGNLPKKWPRHLPRYSIPSSPVAFAVAFPSRLSLSPVSLAVKVSLECRRLLAPSLALALAGTHFPGSLSSDSPFPAVPLS
jgi:hypothetical protein